MALVKCPECKEKVSSKAKNCPHCGYTIKNKTKIGCGTLILFFLLLPIVVGIIVTSIISDSTPSNQKSKVTSSPFVLSGPCSGEPGPYS